MKLVEEYVVVVRAEWMVRIMTMYTEDLGEGRKCGDGEVQHTERVWILGENE